MSEHRKVQIWLYFVCFMVFAMAVIGAITRLTESGLSMVEWRPLIGALPPLSEEEWQRVFDLYQQTPEYQHKHFWMEIDDFKRIFFWEWLHRLWGRLIGLAFALPLLWFAVKKQIPQGYGLKFTGLLLLGGLQGVIGWWMVKSGLADRPEVSHYRLAVHLGLAFILFGLLWWTALGLSERKTITVTKGLIMHGWGSLFFLSITIIWGAFVAGLDAGLVYNTWPLMNGSFLPPEQFDISSIIDQQAWIQFTHRWIAIFAGIAILALAMRTNDILLGMMLFIQIGLGIATLLSQVAIPLAALHQAGAIILLALLLKNLKSLSVKD